IEFGSDTLQQRATVIVVASFFHGGGDEEHVVVLKIDFHFMGPFRSVRRTMRRSANCTNTPAFARGKCSLVAEIETPRERQKRVAECLVVGLGRPFCPWCTPILHLQLAVIGFAILVELAPYAQGRPAGGQEYFEFLWT